MNPDEVDLLDEPEVPRTHWKRELDIDVLTAARQRISWAFDHCSRLYLAFSAGKDSTVLLHLVAEEAERRGRRFGLLLVDLEGQYDLTIAHGLACFEKYAHVIDPYWVALPIRLRNAVSQFETHWMCWEPGRETDWIRQPPKLAITDEAVFPFFRRGMEFEEFVEEFGRWYGKGEETCCFIGIRTAESLNRWRTIVSRSKVTVDGKQWTTAIGHNVFNAYPIYDWKTEDIWTYHGKHPDLPRNRLYDLMYQAGVPLSQQRICQPYGDDQRRGLWLFHILEPATWNRVVARVCGANSGALYAQESGNILGRVKITKPEGHTWESFAKLLLGSMPPRSRTHYENKIAVFIRWWQVNGHKYGEDYSVNIPDAVDPKQESGAEERRPSWRRICKMLLKNDYWAKSLSFSQTKSDAYDGYLKLMKKRREEWGIL